MIIVEGPDGSGKSTLVERIERDWDLTREPRAVSSDARATIPIGPYIEGEIDKGFGMRLYDRFGLISSPMYIPVPDRTFREELLDPIWLTHMWRKFWKLDPIIIVCMPPLVDVLENVNKDESSARVAPYMESIYWSYHNWLCMQEAAFNTNVMRWDYTCPNLLKLSALLRFADKRAQEVALNG